MRVLATKIDGGTGDDRLQDWLRLVDPVKRQRVLRFRRREDAWRTLLADLLVRSAAIERTGLPNDRLVFTTDSLGKPFLDGVDGFQFNAAHSGEWVACAVDARPIGVDVERIRPWKPSVAAACLTSIEQADVHAAEDRDRRFCRLWTAKESYAKALGQGLNLRFDTVEVREGAVGFCGVTRDGKPDEAWQLCEYEPDRRHAMTVCARHAEFPRELTVRGTAEILSIIHRGEGDGTRRSA